jgi:ParB family chromosome partitioning protein
MTNVQTKPLDWFKPDPNQPRKTFDDDELDRLGDDMLARGVLNPLLAWVDGDHGIIGDGWRRWLAAGRKKIQELPVIIIAKPKTVTEARGIQFATVIHRADLSGHEKSSAAAELMRMNPQWSQVDLTNFLHIAPSMGTKLLSPSKCINEVKDALREGKIGISTVYTISKCKTPEEQQRMLAQALAGSSRDQLEQAFRKNRTPRAPAVRVSRVKCVLPSGVSVVVSGERVSLEECVQALADASKEMKRACELGYTARTFAAVMKDRNKKKGVA